MSDKKPQKPIERVTVVEGLKEKLESLAVQANEALHGIATITKSDIVNLILASHSGSLSFQEVESLKATHFDELRFANWMAAQLREAKAKGESLRLQELIERGKPLFVERRPAKPKTPRKKAEEAAGNDGDPISI